MSVAHFSDHDLGLILAVIMASAPNPRDRAADAENYSAILSSYSRINTLVFNEEYGDRCRAEYATAEDILRAAHRCPSPTRDNFIRACKIASLLDYNMTTNAGVDLSTNSVRNGLLDVLKSLLDSALERLEQPAIS